MSKGKENKENILKSKFFLKLLGMPYAVWFAISLIAMIPDETDPEPITWGDMILANITILLIWFAISFVIALIINEVKKNKPKTKSVKEIQYIAKPDEKVVVNQKDEYKQEKERKSNDKSLYTCESKIDSYEYKKMVNYFPQFYWYYVIRGTIFNLVITLVIVIAFKNIIGTPIFFVICEILLMILYKFRLEYYAEKSFKFLQKKGRIDTQIHIEFYDDYFIRQSEIETLKIDYNDIENSIETDSNFYLNFSKRNKIIIVQKNSCDLELINFIRNKFKNLENHLGDDSGFKSVKKYHDPNFVRKFMIVLFIITICSLWGALWSFALADKINPQHGFNFTKNAWVFWCWLPVPILSVILGFKYKNAGFSCTKNIVSGFIIGFLLLIYGSFCLIPTFERDYSNIEAYKDFIDANIPSNGELEIQDWGTYFDEDKTNYTIINAYYDKVDVSNLVKSIENNNNWILSEEIKSELKIFIPSRLLSDADAYYSIYNKTTNQYNTLPEKPDNYEIYAMKYDKSDKQLEIHKFNYSYK